jgi:hypothetical protein
LELKKILLEQMEREAAATRKTVERVPEGRNDWKPHEKSMTLGYLAALVATMPGWAEFIVGQDRLDLSDPSSARFKAKPVETRGELLRIFGEGVVNGRRALEGATEDHLLKPWRFAGAARLCMRWPRYVALGESLFSHLAHHRGS